MTKTQLAAQLQMAKERIAQLERALADERESHKKTAKQFVDEHSLAGHLEIKLAATERALSIARSGV